jgi:hypothetical protein
LLRREQENIKIAVVAGGNKQRDYLSKEDSSSPTAAMEMVLLMLIVDPTSLMPSSRQL